ncbi:MAG: SpoIID/LytB domain-containing protein [Candidatus Neomarinimicrobiota bacterium]|nr:SpoIID/LytB domain-containing protein [Candidatus Neomarinimicrobiota bacterium]
MESSMLVKGNIPHSEPTVSIGLVLPEDNQTELMISFSNLNAFKFILDGTPVEIAETDITIRVQNNELAVKEHQVKEMWCIPLSAEKDDYIQLNPIRAGRGFHWEKNIKIKVLGDVRISLKDGQLFVVNQVTLEKYIMCVATSEMNANCPPALLEAQTIAARSWLLAAEEQKHKNLGLDACNDDCCQRYQGVNNLTESALTAGQSTHGKVLIYYHQICDARYSKSCGGITENNENVWSEEPKPYLRSIQDSEGIPPPMLHNSIGQKSWFLSNPACFCSPDHVPEDELAAYLGNVDEKGNYFRWSVSLTQQELLESINHKTGSDFEYIHSLIPLKRGSSGRIIRLNIDGTINNQSSTITVETEYEIRHVLHPDFLFSSAFIIQTDFDDGSHPTHFHLKGAGWGHGVGLCQIGALGMALAGKSSGDILNHYFRSTELLKLYD